MSSAPAYKETLTDELQVSPSAQEKLVELLNSEDDINGVRIFVSGGGCGGMTYGMTFAESPSQFDSIFKRDDLTVYIDAVALSYLEGVEIDYQQQGMSSSFVFKNVFASTGGSGSCSACGSSGGGC